MFGLRRVFAVAGAQTLLMSLWQVDDDATQALMVDYYYRHQGASRAEALSAAHAAMIRHPKRAHLFYWASFISSGEAGPP